MYYYLSVFVDYVCMADAVVYILYTLSIICQTKSHLSPLLPAWLVVLYKVPYIILYRYYSMQNIYFAYYACIPVYLIR